ncbi:MAG: hypothetical protein P4L85_29125 [Paludisphaera borealis]|uniref:hypothetical protein n=1 Tax=Paludisphaera borealis TaxID=1387353 RepID=UPI0028415B9E|nr:hypothetical protein [Paludisphaera borealis]MDR3623431.1 hypothetical protein [Paludisphaera borealis]
MCKSRGFSSAILGTVIVAAACIGGQAEDSGKYVVSEVKNFLIPFVISAGDSPFKVKELRLYVSKDQGKSWQLVGTASPNERGVAFSAPGEGRYWFSAQLISQEDVKAPPDENALRPMLRVLVKLKSGPREKAKRPKPSQNEIKASHRLARL